VVRKRIERQSRDHTVDAGVRPIRFDPVRYEPVDVQSFAAYWFYLRFGVNPAALGSIFFGANVFAGISALLASRLASRFGLVKTMVFTHLPSNILLILVPLIQDAVRSVDIDAQHIDVDLRFLGET